MTANSGFSAAAYLDRVDRRCLIELGWPWIDAAFLYPGAFDRLVDDEWAAEMRRHGIGDHA